MKISLLLSCIFALLVTPLAVAQPPLAATAASPTPELQRPTPTAIPLPEIAAQADTVDDLLKSIQTHTQSDPVVTEIQRSLPTMVKELDIRISESTKTLSQALSLDALKELETSWQALVETFTKWATALTRRATDLEGELQQLAGLDETWRETQSAARTSAAPPEVLKRIDSMLIACAKTRDSVEDERALVLTLQNRVAQQNVRINEVITLISRSRDAAVQGLLARNKPPLWRYLFAPGSEARAQTASSEGSLQSQVEILGTYVDRQADRGTFHLILAGTLYFILRWARRRVAAWSTDSGSIPAGVSVFEIPLANALLISLLASGSLYPDAPSVLWALVGIAAIIPAVILIRKLIEPRWSAILYAVMGIYFLDQVRSVIAAQDLLSRLLFVIEMLAGLAIVAWVVRSNRLASSKADEPRRVAKAIEIGIHIVPIFLVMALLATTVGYVSLAEIIGTAILQGAYFLILLYAAVRLLSGLTLFALRSQPLALLRIVKLNGTTIHRYIMRIISGSAVVCWFILILDQLSIRDEVVALLFSWLSARVEIGSIQFSLNNFIAFIFAVWLSFPLSRFIRFLLEEEVYARVKLSRGIPYAISTILHYIILVFGFLIAIAALGVDMTKFTVLAGAFGVGLGFGLQTIINNFVSGLIVLFERPIRVGDVVQIDDTEGVVQHIGIRASFIRTHAGAEVIVPNAKLIADRVTNWTFSNRQRAIEIPVNVAYGSDPRKVVEILEEVARSHPRVIKEPKPQALFFKFDADFVTFHLRVFTERLSEWTQIRSELGVAIHAALIGAGVKNK